MKKPWIAGAAVLAAVTVTSFLRSPSPESARASETHELSQESTESIETSETEEETRVQHEIDTTHPALPGARIAVVSKSTKGAFWEKIEQGMQAALDDVNDAFNYGKSQKITMTFEGAKDERDIETQINTLDAVVSENPSVICMSASDMESCQAQLEAARENGIPVVVFDSLVDDMDLVSAFRSTDNYSAGATAADKMMEAVGGHGKIVIFSAQSKSSAVRDRVRGFEETLASHPEVEIAATLYEDETEDMDAAMLEALQSGDVSGVYCTNYSVTEEYLALDKGELSPELIGTDGSEAQIEAIHNGTEYGTVSQDPYEMGYQTMLTAIDLTKLPGSVLIERQELLGSKWLDATNVDDEQNSAYRY